MKNLKPILLIITWLAISAFQAQPSVERQRQEHLPIANSEIWDKLGKAKIEFDDKKAIFAATIPADVKSLSGQNLTITGFMLPLDAKTSQTHFLLSKRTPTCPYCMPGGPTEVVDVYTSKPVKYSEGILHLTGKFEVVKDEKSGLYFRLNDASIDDEAPPIAPNPQTSLPPV